MMTKFITQDFEPSSAAAWKQKIQFDLNGADYSKTLITKTNEGITIKPFYHVDDFEKINIPVSENEFKICQKILITAEEETNKKAFKAIEKGFNSIKFEAKKPFNIEQLFKNLLNRNIEFHFYFRFLSEEFTTKLLTILKNEVVYFNIDIIGNLAKTGNWYTSLNSDFKSIENLIQQNPSKSILSVNVHLYQNAGANTVQQVAYALAHANEYFNKLGGNIASNIQFNFANGINYFFEIAKIRAFRYLLNLILKEYSCTVDAKIFAEPSLRNKTLFQTDFNVLREATESMSAFLSSANTIANGDFNTSQKQEDLIDNELLFLKEDFRFTNTQQVVNNTYYIEAITKQIAEKALVIFKDIEKSGGFLIQLKEGTIQRKIKENAQKEQVQFDSEELVLVGTNKFQDANEEIKHRLNENLIPSKKTYKTIIVPIIPKRLAEKLEQKRLRDEA